MSTALAGGCMMCCAAVLLYCCCCAAAVLLHDVLRCCTAAVLGMSVHVWPAAWHVQKWDQGKSSRWPALRGYRPALCHGARVATPHKTLASSTSRACSVAVRRPALSVQCTPHSHQPTSPGATHKLWAHPAHCPHRWRRQNEVLLEGHRAALQQLAEEQEARVAAMELDCDALRVQLGDKEREAEELRRQLEEDADKEIEELKDKYEQKLQVGGAGRWLVLGWCWAVVGWCRAVGGWDPVLWMSCHLAMLLCVLGGAGVMTRASAVTCCCTCCRGHSSV